MAQQERRSFESGRPGADDASASGPSPRDAEKVELAVTSRTLRALSGACPDPDAALVSEEPRDATLLIARCVAGDQVAATELVLRTHPWVLKWVRAHRARTVSEEDLVQEVYLTVFEKLDRYSPREGTPFAHWLSRVTVNTCLDVLRAEGRRPPPVVLSAQASEWLEALTCERDAPLDEARGASELVDELLAQLAPEDRLVLTLLDLRQLSVAEVAQATGWNKTLVRVRAFRARRRLRAIAERREREQRS